MTTEPQLLLVEDDRDTATHIADTLRHEHLSVALATDGEEGLHRALSDRWDLIVLDRMLPKLDGLSLLQRIRAEGVETPVLFVTNMDSIPNRVAGLRHGADDYIVKPFAARELVARVQVLLRRFTTPRQVTRLRVADVEVNLLTREATRADKKIALQPQELKILEYFMRNTDTIISRQMLLKQVWDVEFPTRTNIVETHLSRLREKLGREQLPLIHTIKGQGYVMSAQPPGADLAASSDA